MEHPISIILHDKGFSDFKPIDIGRHVCPSKHSYEGVRSHFLIHYVVSGKGTVYSPKGTFFVKSGEIFIICPDEFVKYVADEKDPWDYIFINFKGHAAERLNELKTPVMEFHDDAFLQLCECLNYKDTREEFAISCLFKIMSEIFEGEKNRTDYVGTVSNYIKANFTKNLKVEEIANLLGLNRHYLSRIFKEKMGESMKDYIITTRMEAALKLLKRGYSVNQTAYMVGYADQFNFSKMFKKKYGINPSNKN